MVTNNKPTIIFFGAGPVASQSLANLLPNCIIEAVITKPPVKNNKAPVIDLANSHNLPVFTPKNRLEVSDIFQNNSFSSQIGVVIDFGVIISRDVIDYFPLGIINSHFSLLPEWRGADPITFSVLSGQKSTGVSLMRIVEALDEGPIIAQQEIDIPDTHTTPLLTADLINLSSNLLKDNLPKYIRGELTPVDQEHISLKNGRKVSYSKKIHKSDGTIDWDKTATVIEREIRAYRDWPQSRSRFGSIDVIITEAKVSNQKLSSGQIVVEDKALLVGCGEDSLYITRIKPLGKNEMDIVSFLAGYRSRISN